MAFPHDLTDSLRTALSTVIDPEIRRPITELGMVTELKCDEQGNVYARLELTIAGCPAAQQIAQSARTALESVSGVNRVELDIGVMDAAARQAFISRVRGAKKQQFTAESLTRVIAVTSGKGGVGKSSLTVNLACAMAVRGYKVGLIDADVFGFSIPQLMGMVADGEVIAPTRVGDMILPPIAHSVKTISIGMFLAGQNIRQTAVSWRGPMLHRTIAQFLTDVFFGDLDFLFLDLPPGTGDIAISVGQLLPHAEVIVVTTPQQQASDVAVRSGLVAQKTGQKILGVVENMSGLRMPDGSVQNIFGQGGGKLVAANLCEITEHKVPLLAQLELSAEFGQAGEEGIPAVIVKPQNPVSKQIFKLAQKIVDLGASRAGKQLPLSF